MQIYLAKEPRMKGNKHIFCAQSQTIVTNSRIEKGQGNPTGSSGSPVRNSRSLEIMNRPPGCNLT